MGDSLDVLRGFPETVRSEIGYALYLAQTDGKQLKRAMDLHSSGST